MSWTTDRNSREIISRIWDGESLLPLSSDTSSVEPFVVNLTPYPCSGYLLDKRMCKRDVGSLFAVDTSEFFNSYSARACPPTGFLNRALPRIQYYLRDNGFSVDCVLRQRTNQDSFAPVSTLWRISRTCNSQDVMSELTFTSFRGPIVFFWGWGNSGSSYKSNKWVHICCGSIFTEGLKADAEVEWTFCREEKTPAAMPKRL